MRYLNQDEKDKIMTNGRNTFDALMTPMTMTCIMNINKPDNDLIEILANPTRQKAEAEDKIIQLADEVREKRTKKQKEAEDKE